MGVIDTILWPIRWIIEAILVGFHSLFETWGLEGASGLSWVLAITAWCWWSAPHSSPCSCARLRASAA